jgi:HEPN domain-containing protein
MNNMLADKYIEENRKQAERDIQTARSLLESGGNIEHAAFLLEQSYEKLLKAVHAEYRISIRNHALKAVYDEAYGHDVRFMFFMLTDLHDFYRESIQLFLNKLEEEKDSRTSMPQRMLFAILIRTVKMFDADKKVQQAKDYVHNVENKVNALTANKKEFANFLKELSTDNIPKIRTPNIPWGVLDVFLSTTKAISNEQLKTLSIPFLDIETLKKYSAFMAIFAYLSYWIIPHVFLSRYPDKRCDMENLEYYRNNAENIRSFLLVIVEKIDLLMKDSLTFINHIRSIKQLMK